MTTIRALAALAALSLLALGLLDPIPQDLAYHNFADTRALFGLPNAYDVLSNIPFLLVGVYAASDERRRRQGSRLAKSHQARTPSPAASGPTIMKAN